MILLLGTRNDGKICELHALLANVNGIDLLTYRECQFQPVEESGTTFLENALLKARAICTETGLPVLAEDAGLQVVVLGGEPGIHSARYAGLSVNYAQNNALLLKRLAGVRDRIARFVAVAALRLPDGREFTHTGLLAGQITEEPAGKGGFGYDPLFIPDGFSKTLAEMGRVEKNRISHRRRSIEGIKPVLHKLVHEESSGGGRVF